MSAQEALALPAQVYDPPAYAPATDEVGPPGPVSMVFRGRVAREGFTGEVEAPWYAVSARTGEYRRLEAPHLDQALGRLWLDPSGTRVAWVRPGGVATYDTMSGQSATHSMAGVDRTTPLAVSVATDLLREPSRPFESPRLPWAPVAKLCLCLLLTVFPAVYYLVARRPQG